MFFYVDIIFNPSRGFKMQKTAGKRSQPFQNQLYFCSDILKDVDLSTQCFLKVLQKCIEFQIFILQILHL